MSKTSLFALLAIAAAAACVVSAQPLAEDAQRWNWWEDVTQGQITSASRLVFSGRINGTEFEWRGPNLISAYVISARDSQTTPDALRQLEVRGGLRRNYLQVWSNQLPVDATVQIYAEPFTGNLGWRNRDLEVINEVIINGTAPQRLQLNTTFAVEFVEIADLTNGTGAYLFSSSGLNTRTLNLVIASELFRGQVRLRVRAFAVRTTPNHFEVGRMVNGSQHITTQVLTARNVSNGWFEYFSPNHTLDYVSFTDLTNGTGGRVSHAQLDENRLTAFFQVDIDFAFLLNVYGRQLNSTSGSDIIVGEWHADQRLIETRTVYEWGRRTTVVVPTDVPISRIEVRNQSTRSQAVPELLVGEVGGRVVVVQIEAPADELIHFTVNVYSRERPRAV